MPREFNKMDIRGIRPILRPNTSSAKLDIDTVVSSDLPGQQQEGCRFSQETVNLLNAHLSL